MPTPVLVIALLATWSLTQLATRDKITARPRRAVHAWLKSRRHRPALLDDGKPSGYVCVCDWDALTLVGGEGDLAYHVALEQARAPGFWYQLVSCPWCVSLEIALLVGTTAWFWGHTAAWSIAAFALAARVVAGAAVVHLGPAEEPDEQPAPEAGPYG